MFEIGDLVAYKPGSKVRYSITNGDMRVGKVVSGINGFGHIEIEVIDHRFKHEIGGKYWVDPESFIKISPKSEIILEKNPSKLKENIKIIATAEMVLLADKNNKTYDLEYSLCSYNKELGFFDRELLIPWAKTYSKEKLNEFFHKGKWIERKEE